MFAGFDYGTSHCSLGVMEAGRVRLVPLEGDATLIASTLYAPKSGRDLDRTFELGDNVGLDMSTRSFDALRFGADALECYLDEPTTGFFVRSPKSFLGAPGLNELVKERFVGIVAAMMANVKRLAESRLDGEIADVIIGRPINFQTAASATAENAQALEMLSSAAQRAGFRNVAYQFEPVAAAMEFEARLEEDLTVLVIDIGGGTTDCSLVRVGPGKRGSAEREDDLLGHAGERLGGNDYDQKLALAAVLPLLGFESALSSGLPIPNTYFIDAVSTNDVNAQQRFYSDAMATRLDEALRDALRPELVARLRRVQRDRTSYRLLRQVELAKIELSRREAAHVDLAFIEPDLEAPCSRVHFAEAAGRLTQHLGALVDEVIRQAATRPDVVYLTGGMARSTVVREYLDQALGDLPRLDSDHFASVTEGLTLWASRIFR